MQALVLIVLALAIAWTIALTSSGGGPPVAAAPATTTSPPSSIPTTPEPDSAGPAPVPPLPIAEQPGLFIDNRVFGLRVETTRSADFDSLLAGRRVHVIGDSLVVSAQNELQSIFGGAVDVRAESGLGLYYASSWITAAAADPDIVVVSLGTNDWNAPQAFIEAVRDALDTLSDASCVVWVDAQPIKPALAEMNAELREVTAEHGAHIAAWSSLAGPSELHVSDGYHLSAAGQQLFADLIAATVESACL